MSYMLIELLTLGIDAHDEVALAQVFPARHLLRVRPPFLASIGHLGQHPLGKRRRISSTEEALFDAKVLWRRNKSSCPYPFTVSFTAP